MAEGGDGVGQWRKREVLDLINILGDTSKLNLRVLIVIRLYMLTTAASKFTSVPCTMYDMTLLFFSACW